MAWSNDRRLWSTAPRIKHQRDCTRTGRRTIGRSGVPTMPPGARLRIASAVGSPSGRWADGARARAKLGHTKARESASRSAVRGCIAGQQKPDHARCVTADRDTDLSRRGGPAVVSSTSALRRGASSQTAHGGGRLLRAATPPPSSSLPRPSVQLLHLVDRPGHFGRVQFQRNVFSVPLESERVKFIEPQIIRRSVTRRFRWSLSSSWLVRDDRQRISSARRRPTSPQRSALHGRMVHSRNAC